MYGVKGVNMNKLNKYLFKIALKILFLFIFLLCAALGYYPTHVAIETCKEFVEVEYDYTWFFDGNQYDSPKCIYSDYETINDREYEIQKLEIPMSQVSPSLDNFFVDWAFLLYCILFLILLIVYATLEVWLSRYK